MFYSEQEHIVCCGNARQFMSAYNVPMEYAHLSIFLRARQQHTNTMHPLCLGEERERE